MERELLLSLEQWQNWYKCMCDAWGYNGVYSKADTDTPTEFPCLLIWTNELDENVNGFTSYDFIYKRDVECLFN
jgi:hypothetical protein